MEIDFEWYDHYSIGIEEIDAQHKIFVKMMKKTYELKKNNIHENEVFKHLDDLVKYAFFHFTSEETLMKLYEYPKLDHQIEEHNKIKSDLQDKVEKIKRGDEDLVDLLFFLMQWFINHTKRLDKNIGEYMKAYNKTIYGI